MASPPAATAMMAGMNQYVDRSDVHACTSLSLIPAGIRKQPAGANAC